MKLRTYTDSKIFPDLPSLRSERTVEQEKAELHAIIASTDALHSQANKEDCF